MAAGDDGRIFAIQAVVIDRPHPQRPAPSFPCRDCEPGVSHKMRRAIDVDAGEPASIKSISNLRQSAVDRNVMRNLDGGLGLESISAAGTLELECSVIGYIHLLVRAIDPKQVCASVETPGAVRQTNLVKVGGGDSG